MSAILENLLASARHMEARQPQVTTIEVGSHLFNQLASRKLSALVLPENAPVSEGSHLRIVREGAHGQHLDLQAGRTLMSQGEPGLEPGYKAVKLHLADHARDLDVEETHKPRPSFTLLASHLNRHGFVITYGRGDIHSNPPLLDGGTLLVRDEAKGTSAPVTVSVNMKGYMPGLAPGFQLITPPLKRRPSAGLVPV